MIKKYYKNWKATIINSNYSLKDTIKNLNKTALRLCLVNKYNKFYGTVSDGDIRRALLRGIKLNDKIEPVVNKRPLFIYKKDLNKNTYLKKLKKSNNTIVPILDKKRNIINIISENQKKTNLIDENKFEMVIMTGGKGKRLLPLTKKKPKALVKVSGKPILEHIILKAKNEGLNKINLVTNHKHNQIHKYFKDGKKFNVRINYFKESKPLGTAGGLSLLNKIRSKTLLISNCDIVTNINFYNILNYHLLNKNKFTIASRFYKLDNPYGVIQLNRLNNVVKILEKPSENHLISAGIYVIDSSLLRYLKKSKKIDMTDFINELIKKKVNIGTCPVFEDWLDIGSIKDLKNFKNRKHEKN